MTHFNKFLFATTLALGIVLCQGTVVSIDDGLYVLDYTIEGENIRVKATGRGIGYVGFGLSQNASMMGSDLIIAGYNTTTGETYCADYHADANAPPLLDTLDNVEFIGASENETHTTIEFVRALNTGDEEDIPIENRDQFVVWSLGEFDLTWVHHQYRGGLQLNLLGQ